jgi:hypothetical protein
MKDCEKLKRCCGCRNDFYNDKNPLGVKRCWSLGTAKVVFKKEVSIDQVPPWKQKAKRFLSCFHKPRFIYVDPKKEY